MARTIFRFAGQLHVLDSHHTASKGPLILASNHISHFDPPLISAASRRAVHWMAMAELFEKKWARIYLRSLGAFPTDRARVDRASVKSSLSRLRDGKMVGIFPEGGIRAGTSSVLEGASPRPGVAALSVLSSAPIVPCVVIGSDRLYAPAAWLPWHRSPLWVGFSAPLFPPGDLSPAAARASIEKALSEAWQKLYARMRTEFCLQTADLPHTPQERMGRQ